MSSEQTTHLDVESALQALKVDGYSEVVIDHYLNPRNLGSLDPFDGHGHITSECGDSMWVWLRVRDGKIQDIRFVSDICLGAVAAGSMVTEIARGKLVREALAITQHDVLTELGGLPIEFVHCAALAANTLKMALMDYLAFAREPWRKAYERSSN